MLVIEPKEMHKCICEINSKQTEKFDVFLTIEFDPGSGRTLAACLKHASRTNKLLAQRCLVYVSV